MKKCLLMFVFFLATLLLAILMENSERMNVEDRLAIGENSTELILADRHTE